MLKQLFFLFIVHPITLVVLGLNVRRRDRLPQCGPAIVVANHNSHLDTLVLMSLFPRRLLTKVRPVAAADYFLANRILAWFSTHVLGIIPIVRKRGFHDTSDPLAACYRALDSDEILILFPEGSRGEPERLAKFQSGVARLAQSRPFTPIVPVFLYGLGKSLPKGEALFVPFFCDVFIGKPITWQGNKLTLMNELSECFQEFADETKFSSWD